MARTKSLGSSYWVCFTSGNTSSKITRPDFILLKKYLVRWSIHAHVKKQVTLFMLRWMYKRVQGSRLSTIEAPINVTCFRFHKTHANTPDSTTSVNIWQLRSITFQSKGFLFSWKNNSFSVIPPVPTEVPGLLNDGLSQVFYSSICSFCFRDLFLWGFFRRNKKNTFNTLVNISFNQE